MFLFRLAFMIWLAFVGQAHTSTQAAGSSVGSVHGTTHIQAGGHYQQTGSEVLSSGGEVNIVAQTVSIEEAREKETSQFETRFKQSGLSIGLGGAVIDTATTVVHMTDIAGRSNTAAQALAAGVWQAFYPTPHPI